MSFGISQRRELFTDIVVHIDASVVGSEEITRHERSLFLSKKEIRLGGSKLAFGFKGADKIPCSHSADQLSVSTINRDWPHQVAARADEVMGKNSYIIDEFCRGISVCPRGHTGWRSECQMPHGIAACHRNSGQGYPEWRAGLRRPGSRARLV